MLAGASPLVTWFIVRNVSGVPPLEVRLLGSLNMQALRKSRTTQKAGDRKFGDDPKWQEYKR